MTTLKNGPPFRGPFTRCEVVRSHLFLGMDQSTQFIMGDRYLVDVYNLLFNQFHDFHFIGELYFQYVKSFRQFLWHK